MADVHILEVLLYGDPVGTLTSVSDDRIFFAFNESYMDDPDRPLLSLGFKDEFGELTTEFAQTRTSLLPFFSNLLPEGPMLNFLAERAGVNPAREFFLLWALGADLPGAITVRPVDDEPWPTSIKTSDDARMESDDEVDNILRFSLAGVQLKFSALKNAGKLTIPAKGVGGSWIVKLPSRQFDRLPEGEFSMMTLARQSGVNVPPVTLVDVADIANLPDEFSTIGPQALAIERFDRLSDGSAVHIEDFAQIFNVYAAEKYKTASCRSIARVIGAECEDSDIAEFIRRVTFNTLIGNADMHLKNWSLIYYDRRNAALAPAYDYVSTISWLPDSKAALNYSRTKLFSEFTEDELSHLASKARLPEVLVLEAARETASLFNQTWHREKGNLPLDRKSIEAIETHIATLHQDWQNA